MKSKIPIIINIPWEAITRNQELVECLYDGLSGSINLKALNHPEVILRIIKEDDFSDLKLDEGAVNIFVGIFFPESALGEDFTIFSKKYKKLMRQVTQQNGDLIIYSNVEPYIYVPREDDHDQDAITVSETYRELLEDPHIKYFGPNNDKKFAQVQYTSDGETKITFGDYIGRIYIAEATEYYFPKI